MSKGHTLQDPYLNALRKERVPVSIYLVNGIKLQGQIVKIEAAASPSSAPDQGDSADGDGESWLASINKVARNF